MKEDIDIAIVSDAGTPCISDPGSVLVDMAWKNRIEVSCIPGPSAVTAALSVSGFEIEHFAFLGFIPRSKKQKENFFNILKESSSINIFVLFESPNRIGKSLSEIAEYIPDCTILIYNDISKLHEISVRGNISDAAEIISGNPKSDLGEYTIVVKMPDEQAQNKTAAAGNISGEIYNNELSLEAVLADIMAKEGCTLKEAINIASKNRKHFNKNELYRASLKLKDMLI